LLLQALFGVCACAAQLPPDLANRRAGAFMMLKSNSGLVLQWLCRLICVPAALLLFVISAHAQPDAILPPIGGDGGSPFVARCPQGEVLTGFDLRAGDDIDAVRPICIPAVAGQFQAYPTSYGGDGGSPLQLVCPNDTPVVTGFEVGYEGEDTITVNNIHLYCGLAVATPQRTAYFSAVFDAPELERDCGLLGLECDFVAALEFETQHCPDGLIAVGINGRSGVWLDALGLICGAPPVAPPPTIKAQGRVKLDTSGTPPGPARPICELALEARARNSPAAPGLEAQCAAEKKLPPIDLNALHARGAEIANTEPTAASLRSQQGEGPARRGFEIGLAAAEWNTLPGPGKQRVHDKLSPSEQPAYDIAVSFSLNLYKKKLADLQLKGEAIANRDAVVAEFRSLQADASARGGFEIGLAAAAGQTALGPGKQKIRGALNPAEQGGYDTAVTFSIERNNNPALAATGAAIAKSDPSVGAQRNREADALYRLGFDIATGIFGDPARGAQGNTQTGPGSLKIRDSLSAAGQRGFDAAVALHLKP
jgi:hypothetical protein